MGLKDTICDAAVIGFAFNGDRTEAVFSPNNHLLCIVGCEDKRDCTTWKIHTTLEQHDQSVSAIAWHGETDRIISCAHDRTAFVWYRDVNRKWKPQIVMLDAGVKRGLTSCAWSHSGRKIYVGSAAANIAVGRFETDNEWWICRLLDGHTSTVTSLAPHPSDDALLASGGTDGKLMLVSTYMKKLDKKKTQSFGYVYFEKCFGAWVHSIAWTASGYRLAVATHDSRVHIVDAPPSGVFTEDVESLTIHTVNMTVLPLKALVFVAEDHLVGGGFDYYPVLFTPTKEGWRMTGRWIVSSAKGKKTAQQLAREKFQNEARIGEAVAVDEGGMRHKNTINAVMSLVDCADNRSQNAATTVLGANNTAFATASLDGRVELWAMGDVTPL